MVKNVFEDVFIRFDRIHERDKHTDGRTDRQTDRQTDTAWRRRSRLCIAPRGKNHGYTYCVMLPRTHTWQVIGIGVITWLLKEDELVAVKAAESSCEINDLSSLDGVDRSPTTLYHYSCWRELTVSASTQSSVVALVRYHVVVISVQHLRRRCSVANINRLLRFHFCRATHVQARPMAPCGVCTSRSCMEHSVQAVLDFFPVWAPKMVCDIPVFHLPEKIK